ncbi:MAG: hypothetical protein AAF598_01575 [Bacteroidota bacterium]
MRILCCLLLLTACSTPPNIEQIQLASYAAALPNTPEEPLLIGIQEKIYQEFVQSLMSENDEALTTLNEELETAYSQTPQNLIRYWQAYLGFYHAIYFLKQSDKKQASKLTNQAIDILEAIPHQNGEDLALLARLQGFAIQFNQLATIRLSAKMKKNAETAVLVDGENLRAHFVLASNDYYTPEKYGGGTLVEKHLKKAIQLPAQSIENPILPSWGKEESFEMLIKWYLKKKQYESAKTTFQEGIQAFPDSYTLTQLATQLVGK